ncbi:MAG: AlpA family phage regulatory protein [Planctomycetota bacterium]|nr:MAG: AlpA family phage regulatory protein [Planctomycetota bacterium]REK29739.1 MAG: AlpA family phage regulatory protein [Planctomycetota bacterium]REK30439.1 MAG: AlpA family phage regulatory protein [Planctomycetota bacterium]
MTRRSKLEDASPPVGPLMVDRRECARLLGIGPSSWDRMVSAGKTPAPVRLSAGCVRWRLADLESWVAAGCPNRAEFEATDD